MRRFTSTARPHPLDRRVLACARRVAATEHARAHGRHEEFHRVVFREFYGEGRDISRWEILRAAAREVGLDPDAMQREVESGAYTALVEELMAEARTLGIDGVPTYILDGKYAIVGAQPYAAFERALACSGPSSVDETRPPRQFLVRDSSGSTVARASLEPLQRRRSGQAIVSTHLVSLHRQPDEAEISSEALSALYGLTSSEARVAAAAIAAHSINDLAARLCLSRNTVKTQVSSLYRKLGTAEREGAVSLLERAGFFG